MKPRTAVASFIINTLNDIDTDDLFGHAIDFKSKAKALTDKQRARVVEILDHYKAAITHTLATTPFEGDVAEIDGYTPPTQDAVNASAPADLDQADGGDACTATTSDSDRILAGLQDAVGMGAIHIPPPVINFNIEKLVLNA